ncbi:MAG: indolepyruvate ferredoxin oxidoreductase subunit alpha [Promethearchaeota archaeon]
MAIDEEQVYRALQKHLDTMPIGYPATDSGVEIRILKHLFTPDEARIAVFLNFIPETLKKIYRRVKKKLTVDVEDVERLLDTMLGKGSINGGKNPATGEKLYATAFLAVGMFEYQVGRLTDDFVRDISQYLEEAFIEEYKNTGVPQLRTIPIEESIQKENPVASYDEIRHLIETRKPISVAECICRQGKKLIGEGCDSPMETCFQFGSAAYMYINQGLGREVSKEEAWNILEEAQKAGLVLQPGNSKRPGWICCCCGCCCEILTNAKKLPVPLDIFATNHKSVVDADACVGCGACVEICPMDALSLVDNISTVDYNRCIGCGVCVPRCTSDAIHLEKRESEFVPPESNMEMYMKMMETKAKRSRDARE